MMKLGLIIFPFILFNYDAGLARMTDNKPAIQTQGMEEAYMARERNIEDQEYGELSSKDFFDGIALLKYYWKF